MAAISKVLRSVEGGRIAFYCPGCKENHVITVNQGAWTWDNNVDTPTFNPSILVQGVLTTKDENGKWTGGWERDANGNTIKTRCHSFVRKGQIQFLNDCTHHLKGQTIPMVECMSDDD